MTPAKIIARVHRALSPDLLSPKWKKLVTGKYGVTEGHCYIAAEATYHALGSKESGYVPYVASYGDGETHWWLQKGNKIVDPTKEQYLLANEQPPYEKGRPCGFLTQQPSMRAKEILKRAKL